MTARLQPRRSTAASKPPPWELQSNGARDAQDAALGDSKSAFAAVFSQLLPAGCACSWRFGQRDPPRLGSLRQFQLGAHWRIEHHSLHPGCQGTLRSHKTLQSGHHLHDSDIATQTGASRATSPTRRRHRKACHAVAEYSSWNCHVIFYNGHGQAETCGGTHEFHLAVKVESAGCKGSTVADVQPSTALALATPQLCSLCLRFRKASPSNIAGSTNSAALTRGRVQKMCVTSCLE